MRMKASEVGDWVRQIAGKRDHREVVSDDYLVLRPGPAQTACPSMPISRAQ